VRFLVQRIRERLWVKPLALCVLSVGGVFLAKLAEGAPFADILPVVSLDSVEALLSVMASSMLVIATFAVGSMVAAYASASTAATPRSIPLVIADDVTQSALSAFIGAFIFSLVALIAVTNGYFQGAGLFTIFALTVWVFGIVIITFVRWVDRIARLGRVVNTIERVEESTAEALSPGVNDPGTAIDVIGTLVRLFTLWRRPLEQGELAATRYDRVWVPELSVDDLFDDVFTAIARDGAGIAEVAIRLQKALCALAALEDQTMVCAATRHSRLALARSDRAMDLAEDRASVRAVALSKTVDT